MTSSSGSSDGKEFLARTTEATIRIGLVVLLAAWCFQITRPFIIPLVWGIIIATAIHPAYCKLQAALGGRGRLTAVLFALAALSMLIAPTMMFAGSFIDSAEWLTASLRDGSMQVPPPPAAVATWPLIGDWLHELWSLASVNLEAALRQVGPHLTALGSGLLSTAAGLGLAVLQFVVSILIAGVLLASASGGYQVAQAIATRFAGERGPEFVDLAGTTVRSVAQGILGVAFIQSFLLGIGLFAVGVPHASLWTALCLLLAVIQLPTFLVMIPVMVYVFSTASTPTAVVFTLWSILAGASDNVLKPLLLGRGLDIPMVVIFVGAIGGFMASGFIGLFVGAVVLALGYELFVAWLKQGSSPAEEGRTSEAVAQGVVERDAGSA